MIAQVSPRVLERLKRVDVRIRNSFFEKIEIFEKNHQDLILNNHALKRDYLGFRSIDITADWKAVYEEIPSGDTEPIAYFVTIGTHKELYEKHT